MQILAGKIADRQRATNVLVSLCPFGRMAESGTDYPSLGRYLTWNSLQRIRSESTLLNL